MKREAKMAKLKYKSELFTKGLKSRNPYNADSYAFLRVRFKKNTKGIITPPLFRAYFNDGVTFYDHTPPDNIRHKASTTVAD